MKVFICASEIVPFAKTGGLADVAGALPLVLEKHGIEVRIALPKYKIVKPQCHQPAGSGLASDSQSQKAASVKDDIEVSKIGKNVRVYLIKNAQYFDRDGLYGDKAGDYADNLERFSFYCRRSLDLLKEINFKPDIIHCHDWQTALIPVYLKTLYRKDNFYKDIKTLLTIHNLSFQGVFAKDEFPKLGLDWPLFNIDGLEFYHKVNILKGGVIFSDLLNTVSPTYAGEIQTKESGCGLEGVLSKRKKGLSGILNGLDYGLWDPEKDTHIYKPYSASALRDKYVNKKMLQEECRLSVQEEIPLFGMVSRLSQQKGLDLIAQSMEDLLGHCKMQIIVLGVGDARYHQLLSGLAQKYPANVSAQIKFDEGLAHKIYAGADIFLMPSRFEPCGLGQMIALRYGTLPLVFKTGGLADTVSQVNGFVFKEYTREAFVRTVESAISAYRSKRKWMALVKKAFTYNFSWEKSAGEYIRLYKKLA